MNDFHDETQPHKEAQPDPSASQSAGFCQHCGRPLTTDTVRRVGQAVYCEPCLAARIGAPPPNYPPGYPPGDPAYSSASWPAQQFAKPGPNPGLAALLGLIPGVGAMYNEQYAKGIIHLIVFTVLVSFANNVNNIFGLFVVGWIFYMAIEAHHTARARRDGTPLPNPFGLNDIGERLGFGRAWPAGPSVAEVANDAAAAAGAAAAQATSGFSQAAPPYQAPFTTPPWGAAPETYTQAYTQQAYSSAYAPVPPYSPVSATIPVYDPSQRSRFPAGAVWLIGLGVVFLLATTGLFSGFRAEPLTGLILIGLAIWIFLRRLGETGHFAPDGSASYPLRVLRAARFAVWLALLGLLLLFNSFHIFTFHQSWPFFIILAGIMAVLERSLAQSAAAAYIPQPPAAPVAETTQGGN